MLFSKDKTSLKKIGSLKSVPNDHLSYLENAIIDISLMVRELENQFEDVIDQNFDAVISRGMIQSS